MTFNPFSSAASTIVRLGLFSMLVVLLVVKARAQDTFRLDRVAVVKFTDEGDNKLRFHAGILHATGVQTWRASSVMNRPPDAQEWAIGRLLIRSEDWGAYYRLGGPASVSNFDVLEHGGVTVFFDTIRYMTIRPSEQAYYNRGTLANISTRVRFSGPAETATAGFVITGGYPRTVLVRAVGPGLSQFGVAEPLADPFLSVMKNGTTIHYSDNWSAELGAEETARAAVRAGAFPLAQGSLDAAKVMTLETGAYTVLVQSAGMGIAGGEVLIEVYSMPDDFFPES